MLIGLVGKKRSGKDTVAKLLRKHAPFVTMAFADQLKIECAEMLNISVRQLEEDKERFRPFLQWWGTDWRRKNWLNYWVDQLEELYQFMNHENVIVTDVRFDNEAHFILKYDGFLVRVERPLDAKDLHPSEIEQDQIKCQYTIQNDGTIEQLTLLVEAFWTLCVATLPQSNTVA